MRTILLCLEMVWVVGILGVAGGVALLLWDKMK